MSKKALPLLLLGVLLCLLAVAIFLLLPGRDEKTPDRDAQSGTTHTVAAVDANTVDAISYEKDGKICRFTLKADRTGWVWTDEPDLPIANTAMAAMVSAFANLTSATRLETTADALSVYGLDTPALSVSFHDGPGGEQTFLIGSVINPYGGGTVYLTTKEQPLVVYTVSAALINIFPDDPYTLIEPDTLDHGITKANVATLTVTSADGKTAVQYTYLPAEDVWTVAVNGSAPQNVSRETGEMLCEALAGLAPGKIAGYHTADKAVLGLDTPMTLCVVYARAKKVQDAQSGQSQTISSREELTLPVSLSDGVAYMGIQGSPLSYRMNHEVFALLLRQDISAVTADGQ